MIRANRVVVVAAPSGGGKTFLIDRMKRGECAGLCETLGIDDPPAWPVMLAFMIERSAQTPVPRLLVHYDLYAQRLPSGDFRVLPGLIRSAASVKFLTLQALPATLVLRNRARVGAMSVAQAAGDTANPVPPSRMRFAQDRQMAYEIEGFLQDLYRHWFDFTDRCGVDDHWVMDLAASNDAIVAPVRRNRQRQCG